MTDCVHRWLVEGLHGTCKFCHAERDFTNAPVKHVGHVGKNKAQFAIRPRKLEQPIARVSPGYWSWANDERLKRVI